MITVEQALASIVEHVRPLAAADLPLDQALGLVLAEAVVSDVDSPPFDKSLMDGYAVRAADLAGGTATLTVIEEVTAGRVAGRRVEPGTAICIMTGAPLPDGADAVVPVELTEPDRSNGRVRVQANLKAGANIMRRGTSMRAGETVLAAGRRLDPPQIGALAELGRPTVPVRPRPRVAVLATGDELVPVDATPGPGQIRNSNEPMLCAQIRRSGGEPVPLGIARDERNELRNGIEQGLKCEMLLLSGGVSAGKLDLVPSELEAAGVKQVFHKVHIKPGKPVWFGVKAPQEAAVEGDLRSAVSAGSGDPRRAQGSRNPRRAQAPLTTHHTPHATFVFGLPGNPVSSMVCFELFARTALRRLMGLEPATPTAIQARLAKEHLARGDRPTYHPARLEWTPDGPLVTPVPWHGSADLRATARADAMALIPPGETRYAAGQLVEVIAW